MILVGITVFLILIGLGFFAYGAIGLSKYAFRMGTGPGILTLLFPPYTFYFAIFKLEEEGKSWPTASWMFGLVVAAMLSVAFWPDLSAVMNGDMDRFATAEAAEKKQSPEAAAKEKAEKEIAEQKAEEEAQEAAEKEEVADGEQAAEGEEATEGEEAAEDQKVADGDEATE